MNAGAASPEPIYFLLLPNFSMMAFASCVEPLRTANQLSEANLYSWRVVSMDGAKVRASNGLVVEPDGELAGLPRKGTLLVCAGLGAEHYLNPRLDQLLREFDRNGAYIGGVCTGALALARAGLLTGVRCTIHWENVESFVEAFPDLNITATLFEMDRRRATCSGGTAPMDMMINWIARAHGEDLALRVAELLLHQGVRHPHDMQRMPIQYRTGISHPKLLAAIAHMEAYIENPVSLTELAQAVNLSTRQLERLFRQRLGKKPSRYYLELRLKRARLLLQQTSMSVIQVAVASGFASASHFARCYREVFHRSPRAERTEMVRVPRIEIPQNGPDVGPEPASVALKPSLG